MAKAAGKVLEKAPKDLAKARTVAAKVEKAVDGFPKKFGKP